MDRNLKLKNSFGSLSLGMFDYLWKYFISLNDLSLALLNFLLTGSRPGDREEGSRTGHDAVREKAFLDAAMSGEILNFSWIFFHVPSERLVSLGIMGAQLRAPLKPFGTVLPWCSRGFQGQIIDQPSCQDARASRTDVILIAVVTSEISEWSSY